jgi:ATP-dependent exoDNAse (exonuclease V) beta subunit
MLTRTLGSLLAEPHEREQVVAEFLARFARGDFTDSFSEAGYRQLVLTRHYGNGKPLLEPLRLDVRRELPFVLEQGNHWLEGQIDRLVLVSEGDQLVAADVVDFKTGPIAEAELPAEAARYEAQLEVYRQAVRQLFGLELEQVTATLIFTAVLSETGNLQCRSICLA